MLKTIIKLAIVIAVLNALFRGAVVAWDYYQLRDDAQQMIVFGANTSTVDLHNRILARARELQLPLRPEDLTVRRDGLRTIVEARYTQPVEYFPNQNYPVDLSFTVNAFSMQSTTVDDATR